MIVDHYNQLLIPIAASVSDVLSLLDEIRTYRRGKSMQNFVSALNALQIAITQ